MLRQGDAAAAPLSVLSSKDEEFFELVGIFDEARAFAPVGVAGAEQFGFDDSRAGKHAEI